MFSFYLFEGSYYEGGSGWEHLEVRSDLPATVRAVTRYIRAGNWNGADGSPDDDCVIRVYQHGELDVEQDVYPFARVKIPGFTEVAFDEHGRKFGGVPEPGSGYEGIAPVDLEGEVIPELINSRPGEIEVTIDWAGMALPELEPPLLPESATVLMDNEQGTGRAVELGDPDDSEYDELRGRLEDELIEDLERLLDYGYNGDMPYGF